MGDGDGRLSFDGTVHAYSYDRGAGGKRFLGAEVVSSSGKTWIVSYDEQSPYHAFAGQKVSVSGMVDTGGGQRLISRDLKNLLRHLRVSTMRLIDPTQDDSPLVEVGTSRTQAGRFDRRSGAAGKSVLFFVAEDGEEFLVANDPAGAAVGRILEVLAFPVEMAPSVARPENRCLWVICPCSQADLWIWRNAETEGGAGV